MNRNSRRHLARASLFVLAMCILFGQPGGAWAQVTFSVDTTFTRKTAPASSSQVSDLTFTTSSARAARTDKVNQFISDLSVSAQRTAGSGPTTFQAFPSLAILLDQGSGALAGFDRSSAGDINWLSTHLDRVAVVHDFSIHPHELAGGNRLNLFPVDELGSQLHPIYDFSGAAYSAQITTSDTVIPWKDPSVQGDPSLLSNVNCVLSTRRCLDMESLTSMLFTTFSARFSAAVAGTGPIALPIPCPPPPPPPPCRCPPFGPCPCPPPPPAPPCPNLGTVTLGGPGRSGSFKLRFVPQTQFQIGSSDPAPRIAVPGMLFIFEGIVDLNARAGNNLFRYASAKIFIPLLVLFDRDPGDADFDVHIFPFTDLENGTLPAMGMEKLVVVSDTPFLAPYVRKSIVSSLNAQAGSGTSILAANFVITNEVNKYRRAAEAGMTIPNPEAFDVITVPTRCASSFDPLCMVHGVFSTQVQPEDGQNTPISMFILER